MTFRVPVIHKFHFFLLPNDVGRPLEHLVQFPSVGRLLQVVPHEDTNDHEGEAVEEHEPRKLHEDLHQLKVLNHDRVVDAISASCMIVTAFTIGFES